MSKFFVKNNTVILFYNTCYIIIVYYCFLLFFIVLYCFLSFIFIIPTLFYISKSIYQHIQINITKPPTNQIKNITSSTLDISVHHQPPSTWSSSTTLKGTTLKQSYHHTTILSYQHTFITLTQHYYHNITLSH